MFQSIDDACLEIDVGVSSYTKFQDDIFFLSSRHPIGRSIFLGEVEYPLEISLKPVMVNHVKGVYAEVIPPEGYTITPVLRAHRCFARLHITFYKNELHLYRFNNYLSSFFNLATEEEKKVSKKLGMKMLKFVIRWITEYVGRWDRISLKATASPRLLEYYTRNHFRIICSKDVGCFEMAALVKRFL